MFMFTFSFGGCSLFFCECLMFLYFAPRELLQGLHAATRLSRSFSPGVSDGHRSSSIRWSAVVAVRRPHQWQDGCPSSSVRLFFLNSAVFRVVGFVLRAGVLRFGGI